MNIVFHLMAQFILIYSMTVGVALAEADTGESSLDPAASINKMYAAFKSDIAASPELKTCDANALQHYTLNNIDKYVQLRRMVDSFSYTALRKTPPEHLQMATIPSVPIDIPSGDLPVEEVSAQIETQIKLRQQKVKEFNAFHHELEHEFAKFLLADNQSILVSLCQSENLEVLGSDHGGATAFVDIKLTNKSNKQSEARLLLSRSWASWEIFDVIVNKKNLSDKHGHIFADTIESTGLYGLIDDLKQKNKASKSKQVTLHEGYYSLSPEQIAIIDEKAKIASIESEKTATHDFSKDYYLLLKPSDPRLPSLTPDLDAQRRPYRSEQMGMGSAPLKFHDGSLTEKKKQSIQPYNTAPAVLFEGKNPVVQREIAEALSELEVPNLLINYALYIDQNDEWYEDIYFLGFTEGFNCWDKEKSTLVVSSDAHNDVAAEGINDQVSRFVLNNALLAKTPLKNRLLFKMGGIDDELIVAHASVAKYFQNKTGVTVLPISDYGVK